MHRRLYLRLYVAFLGVLIAVTLVTAAINFVTGRAFFGFFRNGPRFAGHVARMLPPTADVEGAQRAAEELHDSMELDLVIISPDGEVVARAGAPLPPVDLRMVRDRPAWLGPHGIAGAPLRDGGFLVLRMPVPEGASRAALLRTLLLLAGVLLVSLALIHPLSRSITRPLEQLTAAVQAYGRGDLSQRSGLGGLSDEVGQLARSFDEMADRIQAARRAEKELLANVSHELRTPLARLRIALELIPQHDSARVAAVIEEVEELDRLIGDVLTASRLDLSELPLRKSPVELGPLLAKSRDRALVLEPALPVSLEAEPLEVSADEALLARAFDNLIDNARKHGRGAAVDVTARRADGRAVVTVRDHGPGFPPADLPRVFDPFFRGSGARAQTSGYGLGLALARRVVAAHGGSIRAENAEGGGARVVVELPAA